MVSSEFTRIDLVFHLCVEMLTDTDVTNLGTERVVNSLRAGNSSTFCYGLSHVEIRWIDAYPPVSVVARYKVDGLNSNEPVRTTENFNMGTTGNL